MHDLKWSNQDKAIARKAFNQALEREFAAVIEKAKQMASRIKEPEDLWNLEDYLTQSRKKIDETYDYRYSVLPLVFGNLLMEGRLREQELQGLGDDKLSLIRRYVQISTER